MPNVKDVYDVAKDIKPLSIIFIGIIVILAISEFKSTSNSLLETLERIVILIFGFVIGTVFNTLYFRWYKERENIQKVQTKTYPRGFELGIFLGVAIALFGNFATSYIEKFITLNIDEFFKIGVKLHIVGLVSVFMIAVLFAIFYYRSVK